MAKDVLMDQVVQILHEAGFDVSERCNIRPGSFDIAARCGDVLLLCKVLFNIDGLSEETASEIRLLANGLGGTPLVIGAKTRDQMLEDNVIYMRHSIVSINVQTLYDYFMEGITSFISASPGGLYVSIDGTALKEARLANDLSLGSLAGAIGVSRRTISKYEEEGMSASIDVVLTLEEILNVELAKPIDILNPSFLVKKQDKDLKDKSDKDHKNKEKNINISSIPAPMSPESAEEYLKESKKKFDRDGLHLHSQTPAPEQEMLSYISTLGYDVQETSQAPFKAISKDKQSVILTGVSSYNPTVIKRARLLSSISDVIQTESVFLINGTSKVKSVQNTVFIEKKELVNIHGPEELIEVIEERKTPEKTKNKQ
ncbi:transcriptional regulator [Methanolapillus millepedarum]|uniref:Putative HTH-type transcriptional regulatory protein MsAc7_04560 n=1 Tax=Methanolapillus millepedarum TaxID=3028296 RepID=A0AA96V1X0_9EURY|nr:hypothetical protein MsAc7_04560 [Methanosarcinaceae archaeon Ac7]